MANRGMFASFARLLCYPTKRTIESAESLFVSLQAELPEAAREIAEFGQFIEQQELWQVEEEFTRVFDCSPECALEIGWHLFGEEYARGLFLVRMREEMRKFGIEESTELPDHIVHVLAIVAAMSRVESIKFVKACVLPAVDKLHAALEERQTPYCQVVRALHSSLEGVFGKAPSASESGGMVSEKDRASSPDPLHAFPVADVAMSCHASGVDLETPLELVQLDLDFSTARETQG